MHRRQADDKPPLRNGAPPIPIWAGLDVRGRGHGRRRHSRKAVMTQDTATHGAAWLFDDADPSSVLTPEHVSDEHKLIGQTAREFAAKEVVPGIDRLEQKDWGFARQL